MMRSLTVTITEEETGKETQFGKVLFYKVEPLDALKVLVGLIERGEIEPDEPVELDES